MALLSLIIDNILILLNTVVFILIELKQSFRDHLLLCTNLHRQQCYKVFSNKFSLCSFCYYYYYSHDLFGLVWQALLRNFQNMWMKLWYDNIWLWKLQISLKSLTKKVKFCLGDPDLNPRHKVNCEPIWIFISDLTSSLKELSEYVNDIVIW